MLVEKRMKRDPVTVSPEDSFRHAMTLIRQKGVRHLPVVEEGRLVGIVTHRGMRHASPPPAPPPSEEAARLMLEHRIGGLPVLQDERLVVILTETDILQPFVEVVGIQQEQTRLELVLEDP